MSSSNTGSRNTGSRSSTGTGSGSDVSAGQGTGALHERAEQAIEQAQDKAGQVVDQAKQQTTTLLTAQKDQAADTLYTVAHALRQTGQQLRAQEQAPVAGLADRVATRVEGASGYLHRQDVRQLVDDTERLGRAHPLLFASGALTLGVLGARFLKSSRRPPHAATGPLRLSPPPTPAAPTPASVRDSAPGDTEAMRRAGALSATSPVAESLATHAPVVMSGTEVTSAYTPHGTGFNAVEDVVQQMRHGDDG